MTVRMGWCSRCKYGPTPVADLGLCWNCLYTQAYALMVTVAARSDGLQEPGLADEPARAEDPQG